MKKILLSLFLALCLVLTACAGVAESGADVLDVSEYFSKRDLSGEWDADAAVSIDLNNGSVLCEGAGVTVSENAVRITAAGTYVISGVWADGSIIVDVGNEDKVQLVLSGASVTSSSSAALLVESADKVFVTLAEGTENTLANSGAFSADSDVDAAVFARDDIVFNGSGKLNVTSTNHGIVGKDDVKFTGGVYAITAEGRGIDANDSVRVYDGSFTIVSGKDAIRAKHDETEKGYILIVSGTFDLTAGGGAENGKTQTGSADFGRMQWYNAAVSSGSTESQKGVKASGGITILGGSFAVNTADDAIHSDTDITVSGGDFTLASGDDAMHANSALRISGGNITITQSYEGLEGKTIEISGGYVKLTASDDGLNAAGGSDQSGYGRNDMFSSDGVSSIQISGGTLIVSAEGDGIDSNGDLTVTGGTIVVSGPTNSGNGALDCAGTATITGGTVIAAGAGGMAENFGSNSTQVSMLVNLSGGAGTITVTDETGGVILTAEVEKQYQCVVVSSPDLQVGKTYTVSNGAASTQVNVTSTIMGGGMGGFGGGWGGWQQGGMDGFGGGRGGWQQGGVDGTSGATVPGNPPDGGDQQPPQNGFGGGQMPGGRRH